MLPKEFREKVIEIKDHLRNYSEALVVFHDDADGLCSGAIIKETLERAGINAKMVCLEKTYPFALQKIHSGEGGLIFYCDIGSAHADWIGNFNRSRNLVIILDHHDPTATKDPKVIDLNLEYWGYKGESDFSGAVICYLFSKIISPANKDLSYLGVIGASELPGGFVGFNKEVLKEAKELGLITQDLYIKKLGMDVKEVFSVLQVLGAVGYYQGGPEIGIKLILEGPKESYLNFAKELREKRKKLNKILLGKLRAGELKQGKIIQWFDAKDLYKGMGSKVIGQFCSFLSYQRLVNPRKYILGFMNLEGYLPGIGKFEEKYSKFSVRVPVFLRKLIEAGKAKDCVELGKASYKYGGFIDGHKFAASGIVKRELIEAFTEEVDK